MTATCTSPLYESVTLRKATGQTIRPGGLELTRRAVDFCSFPPGARVADVGCGTGATVQFLREQCHFEACGVDQSSLLLAEGKSINPELPLEQGRAEQLPYGGNSLDGLFCECVLSLLHEPALALREFYRVLRHGGRLILTDMYLRADAVALPTGRPAGSCVAGACSRSVMETMVEDAGFSLLLWEDHSHRLRELAARLVLAGISLAEFGCQVSGPSGSPGYCLLIAQKD